MPIYWFLFVISFLSYLFSAANRHSANKYCSMILPLLVVGFIVACRDIVLDTYAYVMMFKEYPSDWSTFCASFSTESQQWGFILIGAIFKIFLFDNHYCWFAFVGGTSLYAIYRTYKKYSIEAAFSVFLFIASTSFSWLLNGMRQFWVVCIMFAFANWLVENKKIRFLLLVFALGFIHRSAWFIIPIVWFVSPDRIFDKRMLLLVLSTAVGLIAADSVFSSIMEVAGKDYSQALEEGKGSSIVRFFVAAVPTCIAFLFKGKLQAIAPPHIKVAINMSLVGSCFMFASTFTNGILIGRMPIYFFLYNYYLLPYLIKSCFPKMRTAVSFACVAFYSLFFYYQMCIAWRGLPYGSELLNLYFI